MHQFYSTETSTLHLSQTQLQTEAPIQVGQTENFIDLLFYNLNLSCYIVIEVKIGKFEFSDIGQLGGYVVACNHQLKSSFHFCILVLLSNNNMIKF